MRPHSVGAAALAAALLVSTAASAADFTVYSSGDLSQGMGAWVKTFGTKAAAEAAQDEINSDPETAAALRAQGVEIKNVILSRKALDGSTVYFVK